MKMQLNKLKSGILVVRVDGRTRQIKRKDFSGIPVITQYKYLGILISDTGKYRSFITEKNKGLRDMTKRL